ncbi:hypothetical protein ACFQE1_05010 [Halobium palmae]|uniref:Uncharacterized protein n=1 Tax=Halobium palmae TaxID=1776492 RepID=A0ABD5RXS8_9EURY
MDRGEQREVATPLTERDDSLLSLPANQPRIVERREMVMVETHEHVSLRYVHRVPFATVHLAIADTLG